MTDFERDNHPCFSRDARHKYARIHLPVAPKCNIQCNFCNRKYDCVNEGRPGVTSVILSPKQASRYFDNIIKLEPNTRVAGIAGPGDPFANPEETLETLRLIRANHPEILLCVASNGLQLSAYLDELAAVRLSHATITVNAVDPNIGSQIYAWVRDGKVIYRGRDAAKLLWERQKSAIQGLKERGITVKINTIVIPGINDDHVAAVAESVSKLGADLLNCIPLLPTSETVFATLAEPNADLMMKVRQRAWAYLPQMEHCTRCRADAAGRLGHASSQAMMNALQQAAQEPLNPDEDRPYIAVASLEGLLVNQHLGDAESFMIFRKTHQGYEYFDQRRAPEPGSGVTRWLELANTLVDCRAVLASQAGNIPKEILKDKGIAVVEMEGLIEEGLDAIYRGRDPKTLQRRIQGGCGSCKGSGLGCG
ncbi:MAG TPA: radical SAM protein [Bacillota bacterium]|nr:radical SAM protein [Bacillota bacterium]